MHAACTARTACRAVTSRTVGDHLRFFPPFLLLSFLSALFLQAGIAGAVPLFEDVSDAAGIDFRFGGFVPEPNATHELVRDWFPEIMGGAACWFDANGDGWLDVYLPNSPYRNATLQAERDPRAALYQNQGDGTFVEVAEAAGLSTRAGFWDNGCSAADYDADGWIDLFVAGYDTDILYRNQGDGTFTDVTEAAGVSDEGLCLPFPCWGHSNAWGDFDLDGDLDLYVTNYLDWNETIHTGYGPIPYDGQRNILWANQGDGTFTDATGETNAAGDFGGSRGKGLGVVWFDHERDGCPDLYIANDMAPAILLRNDCFGNFIDIAADSSVNDRLAGMGLALGDTNDDGYFDLYKTHYQSQHNSFYLGTSSGTYDDISGAGELASDEPFVAWGTGFFDFNHDGMLDVYAVNGHTDDNPGYPNESLESVPWQRNQLYLNEGNNVFRDVSDAAGGAFNDVQLSRGSAVADYDWDGDLDIMIVDNGDNLTRLYEARNVIDADHNWLLVELRGAGPNWQAIGAEVEATLSDGTTLLRRVMAGSSYLSQDMTTLHFGLGAEVAADLKVVWPDGTEDLFPGLTGNRLVRLLAGGHITEDTLAPISQVIVEGVQGNEGWWRGDVHMKLESLDQSLGEVSGVASSFLNVDDVDAANPEVGVPLADGSRAVRYGSTDHEGNIEAARSMQILVDTTAPTSTLSITGATQAGWYTMPPTLNLDGSDETSGLSRLEIRTNGGEWFESSAFAPLDDGMHVLEHRGVDIAGNVGTAILAAEIGVDTSPPAISHATEPAPSVSGWHLGPATFTLLTEDTLSGVAEVEYKPKNGGWQTYTSPLNLGTGEHEISYRATDFAGHASAKQDVTIRVDDEAPTSMANLEGSLQPSGWYTDAPRLVIDASDDISGVGRTETRIDTGPWIAGTDSGPLPDGTYPVWYRSIDVAGNVESERFVEVQVDTSPPQVSVVLDGEPGPGDWWHSEVLAQVFAEGPGSPITSLEYRLGDGPWQPYETALKFGDGEHQLWVRATDEAGHEAVYTEPAIRVDTLPPELELIVDGVQGVSPWYVSDVVGTATGRDDGSGLESMAYQVDGGPWLDAWEPFAVEDGVHDVTARATDLAGWHVEKTIATIHVDTVAPTAEITFDGMHLWTDSGLDIVSDTWWRVRTVDETSGPFTVATSLGGGPWAGHTDVRLVGDDGTYQVEIETQDQAGNIGSQIIETRLLNHAAPPLARLSPQDGSIWLAGEPVHTARSHLVAGAGCMDLAAATSAHVSGTQALDIFVDGAPVASYGSSVWSSHGQRANGTWNSWNSLPGPHTIEYRATDFLGHVAVEAYTVWTTGAGFPVPCAETIAP